MERQGNDDCLENEGDRGGDVEMRRALHKGLPGDRKGENHRLKRKHVQQGVEPVLIQEHEADQHHAAGKEMGDVKARRPVIAKSL